MAAHPYFTESSIESDISNYENDPDSFLKDASTMYFEGKVENKDEGSECRIKEDGVPINNLMVSGLPLFEATRNLLRECEKSVMRGESKIITFIIYICSLGNSVV